MTPDQFEALMAALTTFDKRLAHMERDTSESAAAVDEMSKSLERLTNLYVSLDNKVDDNATIISNYVDATRELRAESRNLHTLVREKLKAGNG
jgi:methyl-accepting chemotaxis protein